MNSSSHGSSAASLSSWAGHALARLQASGPESLKAHPELAHSLSQLIAQQWGPDEPSFIRRELCVLLLEDPNFRLRLSHAEACLRQRLPHLLLSTCALIQSNQVDCRSPGRPQLNKPFLQSIILADAVSSNLFTVVPACFPPKPSSVVYLNVQQLVQHAITSGALSMASAATVLPELQQQSNNSHPPATPPAKQQTPEPLEPVQLARLEAMWLDAHPDEDIMALCAYVLLVQGQRTGTAELPLRDLLVWLELIAPLDASLARHPIIAAANTSGADSSRAPRAVANALVEHLVRHPSSAGCFWVRVGPPTLPPTHGTADQHSLKRASSGSSSGPPPANHHSRGHLSSIAETAAAGTGGRAAEQDVYVGFAADRLPPAARAFAPSLVMDQQRQRQHISACGLHNVGELLPAWERLRCAPAKVPFTGPGAAASNTAPAGGSPSPNFNANSQMRAPPLQTHTSGHLPQFLFEFEQHATGGGGAGACLGTSLPASLTHLASPGRAAPIAGLSSSFAREAHHASLGNTRGLFKSSSAHHNGGSSSSSSQPPTNPSTDSNASVPPPPPSHHRSSDQGEASADPAQHAHGIPCRRSPMLFAGRSSSNGGGPGSPYGGGDALFGGRSFPGEFGPPSSLFPTIRNPLLDGLSEVPLEVAKVWNSNSSPGATPPDATPRKPPPAKPTDANSLGSMGTPLGYSSPLAAHALSSPFKPQDLNRGNEASMVNSDAALAAAAAAGLMGPPFHRSPFSQGGLSSTLSGPANSAASPWKFGSLGTATSHMPSLAQRQQDCGDGQRRVSTGYSVDLSSMRGSTADALLNTPAGGSPPSAAPSSYNSGSMLLSASAPQRPGGPSGISANSVGSAPTSAPPPMQPHNSFLHSTPDPHPLSAAAAAAAVLRGTSGLSSQLHGNAGGPAHVAAPAPSSLGSSVATTATHLCGGLGGGRGARASGTLFRDSMESCSQHPSPSSASEHDSEAEPAGSFLGSLGGLHAKSPHAKAFLGQLNPLHPAHCDSVGAGNNELPQVATTHGSDGGPSVDLSVEQALEAIMHFNSPPPPSDLTSFASRTPQQAQAHAQHVSAGLLQVPGGGAPGQQHKSFAAAARAGGQGPARPQQQQAQQQQQGQPQQLMGGAAGLVEGLGAAGAAEDVARAGGLSTTALAAAAAAAAANGRPMSGWAAVAKKGTGDARTDEIVEEQQQQLPMAPIGSPMAAPMQPPAPIVPKANGNALAASPKGTPNSAAMALLQQQQQQQQQAALVNGPAAAAAGAVAMGGGRLESRMFARLSPKLRAEVQKLLSMVPGLKLEDFDDGVLYQLAAKKNEEEALGALRTLAENDVSGIQHLAAYINHVIKNYHVGSGLEGGAISPSQTVRQGSVPVSSKAILQKLPLKVYKRLEDIVNNCSYMEWKHFDAGVIKVMGQLSDIGEEDVFEELDLLEHTDLSNVEYMPAYLNKRLNNRLWSRRKCHQLH